VRTVTLSPNQVNLPAGSLWAKMPLIGAAVGIGGLGLSVVLGGGDHAQLFSSYLVAYLYFLSLGLGGLFFVLIQHLTRAGWSVVVRRLGENVAMVLPLFAVLFIPIALGLHDLFHWSHAEAMATDPILAGKSGFLNARAFYSRAVIYFVVWSGLSWWFWSQSRRQDETGAVSITRRLQALSAPGMIAFAVTLTFASFDWIMSLDPHWFSTIFGVYFFSGSTVGIFALLILLALGLQRSGALEGVVTVEHYHDLGKLLFGFVVFWAYIAFSQFMLIWYANIPEETVWFARRWQGGWQEYSIFLVVGNFALPFLLLLSRGLKRNRVGIALASLWLLAMHYVDLYWLVMPSHHEQLHFSPLDLTTFVGVGGFFFATLAIVMRGRILVPIKDPRLAESLDFENA